MSAIAPLTSRQRNIISAAALREAASVYPEGSKPAAAYWALASGLEESTGHVGTPEIEAAMEAAIALANP